MGFKKSIFLFFSILILAGLTACAKGETNENQKNNTAKGRFVETALPIEDKIQFILGFHQTKDDNLEILYVTNSYKVKHVISKDNGKSWEENADSWLLKVMDSNPSFSPVYVTWDKEDTPYMEYSVYDEDGEDFTNYLGIIDEKDKLTSLPFPAPTDESGATAVSMQIAPNGDFLFDCRFSLLQADSETGEIKHTYTTKNVQEIEGFAVYDNTLAFSDGDVIIFYNLDTGKKLNTITCIKGSGLETSKGISYHDDYKNTRKLVFDQEGALYFADSEGIFHSLKDSSVLEQIVPGDLTSLSMPSLSIQSMMLKSSSSFLLLTYNNEEFTLLSYDYDKDMPALPEEELTVYSLYDNQTIRQAIGVYCRKNPNVHINLELGIGGEDDSLMDAKRLLTARLMGKEGPDLMVLDSLPVSSYEDKGILMDLSPILKEPLEKEELYSNIALSFQKKDGAVYAVPARFTVPMMFGDEKAVGQIKDLDSMVNWLEANISSYKTGLYPASAKTLIQTLYPVCSFEIAADDGSLDMEKLTSFLVNIKKLTEINAEEEYVLSELTYDFGAISWMKNSIGLDVGNVSYFQSTYAPRMVIKEKKKGKQATLFNQNTFIPSTILGINAQTEKKELAEDFLAFCLSWEVLEYNFKTGLPVSVKAMDKNASIPDDEKNSRYAYMGSDDGSLDVLYPSKKYNEEMKALYASLNKPYCGDDTLLDMIIEDSAGYFKDTASLESVMNVLQSKISTYQSEKEIY